MVLLYRNFNIKLKVIQQKRRNRRFLLDYQIEMFYNIIVFICMQITGDSE